MPFDFLGLPRELRDQIYSYTYLLPSSPFYVQVERIPRLQPLKGRSSKPSKDSKLPSPTKPYQPAPPTKPNFRLQPNPIPKTPFGRTSDSIAAPVYFTLSLLRVNRQIHAEIGDCFWQHAIFTFPSYMPNTLALALIPGVTDTFKGMGQTSSRLIRHIRIQMPCNEYKPGTSFPKVLQHIRSRARYGALRKLELVCNYRNLVCLRHGAWFDAFLEALRGSVDCGYERVVRIEGLETPNTIGIQHRHGVLLTMRDLHFACGGKLYWDDILLWENYESTGNAEALKVVLVDGFFGA